MTTTTLVYGYIIKMSDVKDIFTKDLYPEYYERLTVRKCAKEYRSGELLEDVQQLKGLIRSEINTLARKHKKIHVYHVDIDDLDDDVVLVVGINMGDINLNYPEYTGVITFQPITHLTRKIMESFINENQWLVNLDIGMQVIADPHQQ